MDHLTEQISNIRKLRRFNLQGLIDCSTKYLSTDGSIPTCLSISLLGWGGFNTVYRLSFDNEIQLAAAVSRSDPEDFDPQAKLSEIETMKFVRESGLYPDVPVPKVHAWDTTFDNPLGAPYVLMDVVPGKTLRVVVNADRLQGLDALRPIQQLSVVKTLAKLKASLSKPVPFNKIGSLVADPAGGDPSVGPLMTLSQRCLGGPFESTHELWRCLLEQEMLDSVQDWSSREKDRLPETFSSPTNTPQTYVELLQLLSSLIPQFKIPQSYETLVLHHPDIALRNILFDEESISSDHPKITGVIDWSGAQILPLMLTAQYPDDLISAGREPFKHPAYSPDENWRTVPFDWTSIGESKDWPVTYSAPGVLFNHKPRLTAMVRRFYLRACFSVYYADQLYLLHGDAALPHATLYADAQYYLKFHEVLRDGWWSWLSHAGWIRETYQRLRNLGGKATGKELLIIGPNVYRGSVEPAVSDLRIAQELPTEEEEEENPMFDDWNEGT